MDPVSSLKRILSAGFALQHGCSAPGFFPGKAPSVEDLAAQYEQDLPSCEDFVRSNMLSIKEVYDIGVGYAVSLNNGTTNYMVLDRATGRFNTATPSRKFEGIEVKHDPAVTRQALVSLRQRTGSLKALYDSCRMPDYALDDFIGVLDKKLADLSVGGSDVTTPGISPK